MVVSEQAALTIHEHVMDDVTGLQTELDGKSPVGHTHVGGAASWGGIGGTLADQTDLQAALNAKSATSHEHDAAYAALAHNHDSAYEPKNTNIQTHVASTSNPHGVTKAQVGLANVDDTSDASKPVSTATQTALEGKSATSHNHDASYEVAGAVSTHVAAPDPHTQYQRETEKAAANGYASLDGNTRVPTAQLGTGTADSTVFLRGDGTWATPTASVAAPFTGNQATGSFTIADGQFGVQAKRLSLTSANRATLAGSARLVICG